jgi:serine/threonine-protein kinase
MVWSRTDSFLQTGSGSRRKSKPGSSNGRRIDPDAHQQYLLGRFHFNRGVEDGFRKAIPYYEQAITKDPNSAQAYAGLAEAYSALSSDFARPRDAIPKAKAAATTALTLDDSLAEAHTAMGFIHLFYDWDGPAAEPEFTRALQLNPSLASAHMDYAGYFLAVGKREEAVREIRRALALDPLSLRMHAGAIMFLIFARHYDEAVEEARKTLELEPRFNYAMAFQGLVYAEEGRLQEAVERVQAAAQLGDDPRLKLFRAHVHAVAGEKVEAEKIVQKIEADAVGGYICPYQIGAAYVSLGQNDAAYKWLRKG